MHCDSIIGVLDRHVDLGRRGAGGHLDMPRLLDAGVGCQVFACFASRMDHGDRVAARAGAMLDAVAALEELEAVRIPRSAAELAALRRSGDQVGVLPAVEGGDALDGDLDRLARFRERGVCYLTLAWGDNELTGSALGDGGGLTDLGRDAVREMDRLGMLVDVSHMSDAAVADTERVASSVIIASHSNCRSLCASPRNLTDDQIRSIAHRGGVIGVMFAPAFLWERTRRAEEPLMRRALRRVREGGGSILAEMERLEPELRSIPRPGLDVVVDHLEHLAEVGGIGCVALGSDFDGIGTTPRGLEDCTGLAALERAMVARGFSAEDVARIRWDNWARVLGPILDR